MNIAFENHDKVNGQLTVTIEAEDYKEAVEKKLKEYRKKAVMPGFRPGNVPMNMIKRQYGTAVKVDEINQILGKEINGYLTQNNIKMLGQPMPAESHEAQDMDGDGPYKFVFDIAIAPDFTIKLGKSDKVNYYDITIDDSLVDSQVNMLASRNGHYEKVEEYDEEKRDMLKGDIRQLDEDGNTLEGGITVADAALLPQYIKVEEQKALFDNAKLGDIITFNPKKAYPNSDSEVAALLKLKKEEVAELTSDFSYQITEISRYVSAPVDQNLFDEIYGKGTVNSEEEFRQRIADSLKPQIDAEADYKFFADVRKYAEEAVGELTFPEDILKRIMVENNKDKDQKFVDDNFQGSLKELKWHLIKEQLVTNAGIKIEDGDVKAVAKQMARAQFAQYGMNDVPDEYLDSYADDMLKKRENIDGIIDQAIDRKLMVALKDIVTLNHKKVSMEEFQKIVRG